MATEAYCTVCQRTVYVGEGESSVCPVCSSPLLPSKEKAV